MTSVILVDDASHDETLTVAQKLPLKVKVNGICVKDAGVAAAVGVAEAELLEVELLEVALLVIELKSIER